VAKKTPKNDKNDWGDYRVHAKTSQWNSREYGYIAQEGIEKTNWNKMQTKIWKKSKKIQKRGKQKRKTM
jgi:hypothetical protein